MIDIKEINKEIKRLEGSKKTTMNICQQLAVLYIVRDHLQNKTSDNNEIKPEASVR